MKKLKRYDLHEDIKMRLHGSLLMFEGYPHYIKLSQETPGLIDLWKLDSRGLDFSPATHMGVSPEDPRLSLSSPPLGYTNYSGYAYYLARIPARRQKQGLDGESMYHTKEAPKGGEGRGGMCVAWSSLLNPIMNEYPSFHTILDLFKTKKVTSASWHRKLAFVRTNDPDILQLCWATKRIGLYSISDNVVTISPQYAHASVVNKLWGYMTVVIQSEIQHEFIAE